MKLPVYVYYPQSIIDTNLYSNNQLKDSISKLSIINTLLNQEMQTYQWFGDAHHDVIIFEINSVKHLLFFRDRKSTLYTKTITSLEIAPSSTYTDSSIFTVWCDTLHSTDLTIKEIGTLIRCLKVLNYENDSISL